MRLLGAFSVEVGGRLVPTSAWRLRKAAELIRVLCFATGHRLHREQLMEMLWPDRPPDSALNNLHQAVRVARSALGQSDGAAHELLVLRDGVLAFCPDGRLWIDAEAFNAIVRRVGQGAELAELMTARQLYGGEPLPDDRYAAWAAGPRERLAQDYLSLLERIAELQERDGHGQAAIDTLRELLELDPSDEAAHRSLMRLLALGNRRQQALRQFERLRTILARELEVEPSSESSMLYRDILEGRIGQVGGIPAGAGDAATGDQPGVRPPAPSPGHPPRHRSFPRRSNNLPVRLSSFIGRERELRQIGRLLKGARALTLTGPGGAGKTRLGVEAAAIEIGACPDGVWLVELAAISEPELVLQAIADVFDVREQQGALHLDLVLGYLRERSLLLLLDNCEHLVDACASVAQTLLTECPNLRILATSRQPLRIPGELIFRVPSLTIPDPDAPAVPAELERIDSVRLFVERAQAVRPTFALSAENTAAVARLCHHLDGLPLAIELAASRVAVLPVAMIADRLDDRFSLLVGGSRTALSRQQTLRATLDWSYNLLTEPQRRMLRLLSVFAGGAPLDAVELVWQQVTGDPEDPVVILGDLVDQSLIVLDDSPSQPRYRMLESVREYGRDHLRQLGELPIAEAAHAGWAIDLAERAPSGLAGLRWHSLLERLESEHENLRAALDRCLQVEPDAALRLAAGLWAFWLWHGYLAEGRRWLVRALERTETPTAVRGRALIGLASLTIRSGETGQGSRRAEEALSLYRGLGDEMGACHALQLLATAAWSEDDLVGAEEHYRRSLDLARAKGHRSAEASALDGLAAVSLYKGDARMAATRMNESLQRFRSLANTDDIAPTMLDIGETLVPQPETGSVRMVFEETFVAFQGISCRVAVAYALANRGMIKRLGGDLDDAHRDMNEALEYARSIGDERAIAHVLGRLGNLATARGAYAQARELLEECLTIRQRIGDSRGTGLAQGNLGNLAIAEGDLARAGSLLDESAAAFRRRGDMWGYASALGNLASLALAAGDTAAARRRLEESLVAIRVTGRDRWTAWALLQLAAVSKLDGRPEQADRLCDEAIPIFRRIGDRRGQAECVAVAGPGVARHGLADRTAGAASMTDTRRRAAKRGSN